jgi:hypothetical protein
MIHGFHSLQNKEGEETTLFPQEISMENTHENPVLQTVVTVHHDARKPGRLARSRRPGMQVEKAFS